MSAAPTRWEFFPTSSFHEHRAEWDALNDREARSPVLEGRFIGCALRSFSSGREKLAIATNGDEIVGAAILEKTRSFTWTTFQPSQAPLGAFIAARRVSMARLCEDLVVQLPGFVLMLGVSQQDPDLAETPAPDHRSFDFHYIDTARVTKNGSFDAYWNERGKNLRQNLRKTRNRLQRDGTNVRFVDVTDPDGMCDAVAGHGALEMSGWKSDRGTAIEIDNIQGRFYESLLSEFAHAQQAHAYQLWFDDQLVASDLCIVAFGTLVVLKTAYEQDRAKSSPANLLRHEYFQNFFIDETVNRLEFYGRVLDWHTKWTDEIRPLYHFNFHRFAMTAKLHRQRTRLAAVSDV